MQGRLRYRLAFLLAAGGIGLCGYAGLQWHALPHYSEEDLKASTELNLRLDLARQGMQTEPADERMNQLRQQVRAEIEADIRADREMTLRWAAAGAGLLALAAMQILLGRLLAKP